MKKKNILVVGSDGYLGSKITDYLISKKKYECTGLDIGYFKKSLLYKKKKIKKLKIKNANELSYNYVCKFDVVLMLAGISNDPFNNLSHKKIYDPTLRYAVKIAKICKKAKVRFIFPSSCSVYGYGKKLFNENDKVNPLTAYSSNKYNIERELEKLSDKNFSPIALRIATVYGVSPMIRFDVIINMLVAMSVIKNQIILNSNGLAWRPHVYIDDVCEAFKCSIDWDYNKGKLMVLNLGSNQNNLKIIDIAKMIKKIRKSSKIKFLQNSSNNSLVKDRKIQDGVDKRSYRVSFKKIEKTLPNFKSRWPLAKGIKKLIKDLKKLNLNENTFSKRDYYRLQQLEYLHQNKYIDDNLNFIRRFK